MKLKNIIILTLIFGLIALITYRIISNKNKNESIASKGPIAKTMTTVNGIVLSPQKFSNELTLFTDLVVCRQIFYF